MFKKGDIVRITTQNATLWPYYGQKGEVSRPSYSEAKSGTVYEVEVKDPKNGRVGLLLDETEMVLWNGLDEAMKASNG